MSTRSFARVSLRTGVCAVSAALLVPVTAQATSFGPGSPGIGDPYYPTYGNGGYDVSHYAIHDAYDPGTGRLTGRTVITARATQGLSRFDLDFLLPVRSVSVNGRAASGIRQYKVHTPKTSYGGELVVTPKKKIRSGDRMRIVVRYAGKPGSTTVGGFSPWYTTPTGAVVADEAEASDWWFPANDHPLDKASYDVSLTVPRGLKAISNGRQVATVQHPARQATTFRWQERRPMATYLAFAAIGDYDVHRSTTAGGLPVVEAYENGGSSTRAAMDRARSDVSRTAGVVDWLSRQWGPYPFGAVGGVVPAKDMGYALETQTRPTYGLDFWEGGGSSIYVVVHENAHQWFGDSVSVHHWRNIWLNEGFAGFSEWLWSEKHGDGSAQSIFDATYAAHPADDPFWTIPVANPSPAHLFADPVYDRGAMTLQALRNRIGDPAFFQLMRDWAAGHRYGNGTTGQFTRLAERISGQDLGAFFRAWLHAKTKPAPTAQNGFPQAGAAALRPATAPTPASLPEIRRVTAYLSAHRMR
ncbi:MAG: M1 family metallopeptidase [Marmoricola sp.]